jgi:hypothetical protein
MRPARDRWINPSRVVVLILTTDQYFASRGLSGRGFE